MRELKKGETDIKISFLGLKRTSVGSLLGRIELVWMHGVIEAKDRAFCSLCEKLNQQQDWDSGFNPVTSENHHDEGTGDSEDGGNKYQNLISGFKTDICLPGWI